MRILWMAAAVTAGLLPALPARAHAFLQTATPAVGSTVRAAPTQVMIDFTAGVEPAFSSITVTDANGASVAIGDVQPTGERHLAIGLRKLAPGTYHVTWHVTATDTHKTEGSFSFTVAP